MNEAFAGCTAEETERFLLMAAVPQAKLDAYYKSCREAGEEITTDGLCQFLANLESNDKRQKTNLASLYAELRDAGWEPGLTEDSYERICNAGFRGKNLALAAVTAEIAATQQPITLRGLFYRVVSAGWLPSTDQQHYNRVGRILTRLRETGIVPFSWIVDNLRSTVKPSSWSGVGDFAETVRDAYRRDFWAHLPDYVHVFCEKDAIAGVLAPVTREYDIALSPIRGYSSLSFAHEIAETWNQIEKPIHAFYLGDFDPSGFDLERDIRDKLAGYCDRQFSWVRLGVNQQDFAEFDLLPLDVKHSDRRSKSFVKEHGDQCAELDALPPDELRRRVREATERFIPQDEWQRLQVPGANDMTPHQRDVIRLRAMADQAAALFADLENRTSSMATSGCDCHFCSWLAKAVTHARMTELALTRAVKAAEESARRKGEGG